TLLGSFFCARRWASATDSNHGFWRQGLASAILDRRDTVVGAPSWWVSSGWDGSDRGLVAQAGGPAGRCRDEGQRHRAGGLLARRQPHGPGVVLRRVGDAALSREQSLSVPLDALGVRAVHRQPGEELGRHAATPAAVVEVAGRA